MSRNKTIIKDTANNQNTFNVVLVFILFVLYPLLPNVFFALISWFLRWWCGVSFVSFLIMIVLVLCSTFVLVVFIWFFRTKDKIRDNEHKQTKHNNRNNEQDQRTTHQQHEQRTISNTKKETRCQGTKQHKNTANN